MIVDSFMFFNELDQLALRLDELDTIVDRFVLVEAAHTLAGVEKPMFFQEHRDKFAKYLDRIVHVSLPGLPPLAQDDEASRFRLEAFQRNAIMLGLLQCELKDDDIVLISDVDEIPSCSDITDACNLLASCEFIVLKQALHYFWMDHGVSEQRWLGPVATHYRSFGRVLPHELRMGLAGRIEDIPSQPSDGMNVGYVERGGWHLTYFGGKKAEQYKMANFSHGAGGVYGNPKQIQQTTISQSSTNGLSSLTPDLRSRLCQYIHDSLDNDLPSQISADLDRFYHLFKQSYQ